MKKALFLSESRRVYRPDEAPDSVREKALQIEAEGLDASWISESVFGTCKETGLAYDEGQRGIRLEISGKDAPTWADPFSKSYGAGLVGRVDDIEKFLAYLAGEGHLTRNDIRRLRYVDREGGLSLSFHKRRGYGEGTVADFGEGLDDRGRTVPISDCEEKDLPQDETDEVD